MTDSGNINTHALGRYTARLTELATSYARGENIDITRNPRDLRALAKYDTPQQALNIWLAYIQEVLTASKFNDALAIVESTAETAVLEHKLEQLFEIGRQQHGLSPNMMLEREKDGTPANGIRVYRIIEPILKSS